MTDLATVTPILSAEPKEERRSARAYRGGKGPIIPEQPLWQQVQRIGGALTPQDVSAILRDADNGRMARLMDLANEARQKSCHLQGILETRENAVAALPWEMELPPKATKKEKKAAALCEEVLRPLMPAIAPHHNGSVYFGFAVSELEVRKSGRYVVPVAVEARRQRRFRYSGERLVWWEDGMPAAVDFRSEYPGRFIVSEPRVNGDTRCREGLVRPLMWAALFWNWSIVDWLKLAELTYKPWRIGTYDKEKASDEDIAALEAILEQMSSSGLAVKPNTDEIELVVPQMSGSSTTLTHKDLINYLESAQSKAVLGQTLTTDQGNKGTQALGTVHNEVRRDKRDGDARFIGTDVSRDVVEWVTLINFGPSVRPSRLRYATEDAMDLQGHSTAVKTYVEAGLRIPASYVYDQAGIPAPKEGEEILVLANTPAATSPGDAEDPADDGQSGDQPKTENEPDGSEEEDASA